MGEAENNCLPGYDGNGNVAVLVKTSTGTVAAAYEYSPFGETLAENGEYAEHNPFRFSTKYAEAHSNLIYYGHRYHSPTVGSWESRDPIEDEGGTNLYGFLANNPIKDAIGLRIITLEFNAFIPGDTALPDCDTPGGPAPEC